MRRGIGVGYVQEKSSVKDQMKELGSRITAERVTDVLDQLEELEKQLRVLAKRYERDIQEDPVVRARFRQLGESLGLDLLSSQKNIFSGVLGIGTFYYRLAGKVVECCMTMRKYFGSYVPLSEVVAQTKKSMGGLLPSKPQTGTGGWSNRTQKNNSEEVEITQDDVLTALRKLRCFGSGYDVVTLGGVMYIRTSGDGTEGKDSTYLLNFLLEQQEKQHEVQVQERGKEGEGVLASPKSAAAITTSRTGATGISSSSSLARPTAAGSGNDMISTSLSTTVDHSRLGAAYVLGVSTYTSLPITDRIRVSSLPFSLSQIVEELHWEEYRAIAVISRLVQDGTLWVDYPYAEQTSVTSTIHLGTGKSKQVPALRAVEKKGKARMETSIDGGAVYWFLPQR